ncbi:DUF7691 family protein [Streptomyces rishiriensis]|uniref:DUF7691 family protein n=1 Tax=Streptomyces rishiriensis TaxID=68264 RepID=UPI003F4D0DCB
MSAPAGSRSRARAGRRAPTRRTGRAPRAGRPAARGRRRALDRANPAAEAHRAVRDEMDPDFQYDVQELSETLESEHVEWEYATKNIDWYTQDTLFFQLT